MGNHPKLALRMVDQADGSTLGMCDGPASSEEIYLLVRVHSSAQVERQVQVQQGRWRTRTHRSAALSHGSVPSIIWAKAGGAADGGILVSDLAIEHDLSSGVIADVFVSQQRDQALLQGSKAAFDLTFGLRAGSDQMGYAQGGKGALELRTGITIIGHGIMTKQAQAIGVNGQRQAMLQEEATEMFEVIPGCIGRNKDRAQEFSRMIIDREQEGLFVLGRPPLVDGGIVLPELAQTGAFPATAGFGTPFREEDKVGEMSSDKRGDGFAVALEAKADRQFIGSELKVGRLLERYKIFEESAGFWRPVGLVVSAGDLSAEAGAAPQPTGAETIEVGSADLEMVGRVGRVNFPRVKLLENPVKKRRGEAFSQLFFSQSRVEQSPAPWSRVFVGLRYAPASSNPRPRGHPSPSNHCLLLFAQQSPFVRAPTREL